MVVAERQRAQLPAEALAAGVLLARRAVAVAPPVADGLQVALEQGVVGEHRAALAHGDVVGGVEAQRAHVAEGARQAPVVGGAERIAAVLHDPQVVPPGQGQHRVQVEGIAQGVGEHDGAGLLAHRGFQLRGVHVAGGQLHVHEHRHQPVEQHRVHRGGKAGGHGDHLVTGPQGPLAQGRRGQRGHGQQVGRGARVGGERVLAAQERLQPLLEGGVEAPGGQPEVQRGVHQRGQLRRAVDLARGRDGRLARDEGPRRVRHLGILAHQLQDARAQLLGVARKGGGRGGRLAHHAGSRV